MDWAIMDCIDYFHSVDRLLHWHIKWQIEEAIDGQCRSRVFNTTIVDTHNQLALKWFVSVSINGDSIEFSINQLPVAAPIAAIARFAVSNRNKETIFTDAVFCVFNYRWTDQSASLSSSATDCPLENGAIIHCWLDLPSVVPSKSELRRKQCKWEAYFCDCDDPVAVCGPEKVPEDMYNLHWSITGVDSDDEKRETFSSLSDVTLVASDGDAPEDRFLCHRIILAARSPVFFRMFGSKEWKENSNQSERVVVIEDIDKATMSNVLEYIYTGDLVDNFDPSSEEELFKGVYAAEKYGLLQLKEWLTAEIIRTSCNDSSRIKQLQLAQTFNLPQLHTVCIASLSTKMAQFSVIKEGGRLLSDEFLSEVIAMAAKRQVETNQITVMTHKD